MSLRLLIKGGVVWSHAGPVHDHDLLIQDGRILRVGRGIRDPKARPVSAKGWVILPGLVDLHAHLGEPGREDRETLQTGLKAAAWGGFTSVLAMPDTEPAIDRETDVYALRMKADNTPGARLFVCSALTKGRLGAELAELAALRGAGAVAAGDAKPVRDANLMRRALEYAGMLDMPVFTEAHDEALAGAGVAHEGDVSTWLGLAGIPEAAEWVQLARDLLLAESTGGRLHVQGISTARSVELIKEAKARGVRVSAECSFHHLILTDEALLTYDTAAKLQPPLRGSADAAALVQAVRDGVIDCVVTDHTPATPEEKDVEFDFAPFGAAGLEVALAAVYTHLVTSGAMSWTDLVQALSFRPRAVLGLPQPGFAEGDVCELTLFNPDHVHVVDPARWQSLASNTPLAGAEMKGRVEGVYVRGEAYGPWAEEE